MNYMLEPNRLDIIMGRTSCINYIRRVPKKQGNIIPLTDEDMAIRVEKPAKLLGSL